MNNKFRFHFFLGTTIFATGLGAGEAKYLDIYVEEARLFGVATAEQRTDHDLDLRVSAPYYSREGHKGYQSHGISYDFEDKRVGDFSVSLRPGEAKNAEKIGIMTNLWGHYAALDDTYSLKFYLKTQGWETSRTDWKVQVFDAQGNTATGLLTDVNTQGGWRAFSLPLKDLQRNASFNPDAIRLLEFQIPGLGQAGVIKFDFVRFESTGGTVVGITDKTIDQHIADQRATRQARIIKAFEISAEKAHAGIISAFALMYLNRDLARANQILRDDLIERSSRDTWGLMESQIYCRFYFWFSSRGGTFAGRLEPETETLLLKTLWDRTVLKNDIHWARQSTWFLDGSENHDLSSKAVSLVSSRIFMNEPDYKDRVYPDHGFGGAYHYGRAGYYGKSIDAGARQGGGRANLSDGRKYTAKDHYEAWLGFIKEYFRERARHGFFVENASSGYAKHTMNMIDLAYAYSGDEALHKLIGNFMSLYYADYVQTGIAGISGGPKTRHHKTVGGYDANSGLINFHLGGPADGDIWYYWNSINGYELPKVVQMMAFDREGMGTFVYRARGIGEADPKLPHPFGTERTLVINPESRFLEYSYVTPLYTLSTQMDHPWALHSHLSKAGRWHGMTVARDAAARIVPVVFPVEPNHMGVTDAISMEGMYQTAQHHNTLIVQRSRSYSEAHPAWFPLYSQRTEQGIHIGKAWDERIERDGWIFLRKGEVYAALRVVQWDKAFEEAKTRKQGEGAQKVFHGADDPPTVKLLDKPYAYRDDGTYIAFDDRFSPVIIQAGDSRQFGSFAAFMDTMAKAEIALYKTVVPSFHILVFTPPGNDAVEMVFNAANNEIPIIDGKYIDYEHTKTFDSPYIKSEYRSGRIHIAYDGETLDLDFAQDP